ncbi:TetR/AcrR family transcriptional regulator [Nocardia sp. NPDC055321]
MAARKVLTRAESQARTRDELIEAAEILFYANGYFSTSLAAIAAEAGRTIGAVYSNFESKEALCLEVLRGWGNSSLSRLVKAIAAGDGSLDQRRDAISSWWSAEMAANRAPMILAAEYAISVIRDPGQREVTIEAVERIVESGRVLFLEHLPEGAEVTGPLVDSAVRGVLSTGVGLAVGHVAGVMEIEKSVEVLTATMEFWLERLGGAIQEVGRQATEP